MNDDELNKLLQEVKADLLPKLESFAKSAADDSPDSDSSGSSGPTESDGKTAEADSQKAPGESAEGSNSAGESPEPSEDGPPAPGGDEAAPADGPPGEEGEMGADPALAGEALDAPPSPEEIQAAYMELPDDELKIHFQCCKAALMARAQAALPAAGGLPGAAPMAPGAPAAPPVGAAPGLAPAPAAPPMAPNPMAQSPAPAVAPMAPTVSPPDQGLALKSLKEENEVLKKSFQELLALVPKPMGKSIQHAYEVSKVNDSGSLEIDQMSEEDINRKLTAQMASGKLHKSESDRILAYNLKLVTKDQIKHLLK